MSKNSMIENLSRLPSILEKRIANRTSSSFSFHEYQATAIYFIWKNLLNGHGTLIPLDMGLGKTLIATSFLYSVSRNLVKSTSSPSQFIVIAPASLLCEIWEKEALKLFCADEICIFHGENRPQKITSALIITSMETLFSEYKHNLLQSPLFQLKYHTVIVDEAHNFRNAVHFNAAKNNNRVKLETEGHSGALFYFREKCCANVVALTRTPIQKTLYDLC